MKKLLKNTLVKFAGSNAFSSLFDRHRKFFVPIFMLHRFDDPVNKVKGHSLSLLREALTYVENKGYSVISLESFVDALDGKLEIPKRSLVFTADDGFQEQLQVAQKIFSEFNFPISIFIISDFSSGNSWPWDYCVEYIINRTAAQHLKFKIDSEIFELNLDSEIARMVATTRIQNFLKSMEIESAIENTSKLAKIADVHLADEIPEGYQPILWREARQAENYNLQFGPHSVNHAILASQSASVVRAEIGDSWQQLKQELKNPLDVFCYPTGRKNIDFGQREMDLVKELGMRAALSVTPGYVNLREHGKDEHRFCLPRFGFPDNIEDFIQLVSWIELFKEKFRGNL